MTPPPKRPSMGDVAKLAGVSPQTVSRVSNGEKYVSTDKRERVLTAMKELNYRPNSAARAMKRGMFRTIGVVYSTLHPVGTHRTLEAISDTAARRGYAITLIPIAAGSVDRHEQPFTRLEEKNVDALVAVFASELYSREADLFPDDLPTVVLGPQLSKTASSIDFDQAKGTTAAVQQLLDMGHTTVHHIAGPADSYSAQSRQRAWEDTLRKNQKSVPPPVRGDWSPLSGYHAALELFERERPTALFVANDQMALGAYRAAAENKIQIPQDLSVVGFDNIDESTVFAPPLTTIKQDWEKVGEYAISAALDLLEGGTPQRHILFTELVPRDSWGKPSR